jgi:SPP1 gp7 family putative phage head morphogenesis protein
MGLFERFDAAVADLRSRIVMSDAEYAVLTAAARAAAFKVAGLQQLRMVQLVLDSLTTAIGKGQGLSSWRKQLGADLKSAWGKGSAFRLETIFRNSIQSALNRGRFKQMTDPAIKKLRPFWLFDAVLDSRVSTICRERDQIVLPQDDPWWDSNYPPLHHRCRSGVRTLRAKQAQRKGISDPSTIETTAQTGFGAAPATDFTPDLSGVDPALSAAFERRN